MSDTSQSPATRQQLQELHSSLVAIFTEMMQHPETLRPFHLNVIRQFLKDNNVTKNLPQAKEIKATLEELGDLNIPFLPNYQP